MFFVYFFSATTSVKFYDDWPERGNYINMTGRKKVMELLMSFISLIIFIVYIRMKSGNAQTTFSLKLRKKNSKSKLRTIGLGVIMIIMILQLRPFEFSLT